MADHPSSVSSLLRTRLRRLAWFGAAGLLLCYAVAVAAGYAWLRFGRDVDQVSLVDVATFDVRGVRRAIAAQHFATGQAQAAAREYQAAYVSFLSGLSNDPDNVDGRLAAVQFLRSIGAQALAFRLLEEGAFRLPGHDGMMAAALGQLMGAGREREALDLIRHGGTNAPRSRKVRGFEMQAILSVEGPAAAAAFLERNPDLADDPQLAPARAQVLWFAGERERGLDLLAAHVGRGQSPLAEHALLVAWQLAAGQRDAAISTARSALASLPGDANARLLLIETLSVGADGGLPPVAEIETYLREHAGEVEPLAQLSILAGRKGWLAVTELLFQLGASTQADVGLLALCHADALATNARSEEARQVLASLDAQVSNQTSPAFLSQLRSRQVVLAAQAGDVDNVRNFARRLGAGLRGNAEELENFRRQFERLGITAAVVELTPAAARPARSN